MKLETLADVEQAYGKVTMTHANGVFIAVVPVMGGIAIGCGSGPGNAVYDLICDLTIPNSDARPKAPFRQVWEIERRQRMDGRTGAEARVREVLDTN